MKTAAVIVGAVAVGIVAAGAWYMVDIEQTQKAALPEVDVEVEGGQLPEYEVRTGSIDVGSEEATIETPEVNVEMTEQTITVPTIDIETPEEKATQ